MAYTFTVETGEIIPGANSYVSVQAADDYLSQNIHVATQWAALTQDVKEKLLSWASRYLDQRVEWNGRPISVDQPMRWPRVGVKNADKIEIPPNTIPPQLVAATCEMARHLIDEDRSAGRPQDALQSLKVDVISMVFKDDYKPPEVPNDIGFILTGLATVVSGSGGFGRIRRA